MNTGKAIKHLLIDAGMNQGELAKAMNLTKSAVSIYCLSSGIHTDRIVQICDILNVSVQDFIVLACR